VNSKRLLAFAGVVLLLLGTAGTLWALNADYNRPNPLMDYAPQETAIFDTRYDNLGEMDCRACHGDSLADRHHNTLIVLRDHMCTPCHEVIPDPPGVVVIRDCTTSGCHSWDDVYANGWHHTTDLSGSENCVACHDTNIVAEITPFSSFQEYPPSVVTPSPFSCENCHWEQGIVDIGWVAGDPDPAPAAAGHPSTYEHEDAWGNFVGYYEYGKPILGNFDNHHMGFKGNVAAQCWKCHANDPNDPSWNPYDEELIRYCEICHDVSTLHTIFPHVGPPGTGNKGAAEGWEAVGFHAGGGGDTPTSYVGNTASGITNSDSFLQNEMCWGCHGDDVPAYVGETTSSPNPTLMTPMAACPTAQVEITGSNFVIEKTEDRGVKLKEGTSYIDVPIYSWTDTRIVFELPAWTFTPGNHKVKVYTEFGANSTLPKLTVKDCASPKTITPDSGACKTLVTLTNGTGQFGSAQDTISAAGATDGIYRTVVIAASQGTYVAQNVKSWGNNTVKVKFSNSGWFEDSNGNFLRDGEAEVLACDGLAVGTYSVYFKYVFYGDDDSSGTYTTGDTMYQVETSNSLTFELTNEPMITGVNPKAFVKGDRVKIIGVNFGPTQTDGEVYIGRKGQYNDGSPTGGKLQTRIKMWSSTKIKIKARFNQTKWGGSHKYVWVVKDGMVSNAKKIEILP
jgi:hypothetical protein